MEFTAEGSDIAPPLRWTPVPEGTKSVAVIVEDPDAPDRTFVHWIAVGIPPYITNLLAGGELPPGAAHGINDRGTRGWTGPNPPNDRHRYFFKVFALDINLEKPDLDKRELYSAMKGHILARGELIGTYEKKLGRGRGPRANMPASTGAHTRNR